MIRKIVTLILLLYTTSFIIAQEVKYKKIPADLMETLYAKKTDLKWFKDAKFGVFVHWGPYVLAEVPASWGRLGKRPGAGKQAKKGVPAKEYDQLYTRFNPVHFDAEKWIKMVKKAGAKYFIFTTKHHDGFCMFDAHNTDYKITNTPFKRDIAKEIADACHKYGIKLFWYYSQPDWHHPDCLTERNATYRAYMYQHLKQLCTEYGKISGVFFDGLGTKYYNWDTPKMVQLIRKWQPGIIINRRWGGQLPGKLVNGDYDNPEQEFGLFERERPWEMCATIAEAWSWTGAKSVKSYETLLGILIRTFGSGGNMALNTGPRPDGMINPDEAKIYTQIGRWLKKYAKTIYVTLAGPYKPGLWGVSTCKGKKVYLHITCKLSDGNNVISLPQLDAKVKSVRSLSQGDVSFSIKDDLWNFAFDTKVDVIDRIVELTLDKNATLIPLVETYDVKDKKLPFSVEASSNDKKKNHIDVLIGKGKTVFAEGKKHKIWWAPKRNDDSPWFSYHFSKPTVVKQFFMMEQIRNCSTRAFRILGKVRGQWKTLYEGKQIGIAFSLQIKPTKVTDLKVLFLENEKGNRPNIGKFECY